MAHDLRLALRLLASNRGFAAAAIVTLALGIGANTAIFSVVHAVLLRPSPLPDINRLVVVWETDRNTGTMREPASVPDYLDFRSQARRVDRLTAIMPFEVNLAAPGGEPLRVAGMRAAHETFALAGVQPLLGRLFTADDDMAGGAGIVLLGESIWRRAFDADPSIVGRTVHLDDQPRTIAGVLPADADFGMLQILSAAAYGRGFASRGEPARVDVWAPLRGDPQTLPRETHPIFLVGRLADGSSVSAAQAELEGIAAELERAYPVNRGRGVNVEPLADVVFAPVRPTLYVLLAAVALVLLVACVNVASLLLARGAGRAREIAVRRALGAGTGALARQFLVESAVLTLAAAAAGIALASAGVRILLALAPGDVPRLSEVRIDPAVLLVTLAVSAVVTTAFGLIPLAQARRIDPQAALADTGSRGTAGPRRARLRGALVAGELALAVVLLVGAGLLIRSFWNLLETDSGFAAAGVVKAEYQLPASRYPADMRAWPEFPAHHAFTEAVIARARALPGVTAAAVAGNHPLDPGFTNSFVVVGREAEARSWPEISVRRVSPGYFETVGLRTASGRLLTEGDTSKTTRVMMVNEAAGRRFFTGRDPLGAQIRLYGQAWTIVGVIENERFHGIGEAPPLAVYLPLAQAPSVNGAGVLLARTEGDARFLMGSLRAAIQERDPALAVFGLEPLDATVARSVGQRRFAMVLVAVFAAVALLLGAVGIHGVLSYEVAARGPEIGIRLALGARPSAILRTVVGEGLLLTAVGLVLGVAGATVLSRLIRALLFGVNAYDPGTIASVATLLGSVAVFAAAAPAWRAANTDPAAALKQS